MIGGIVTAAFTSVNSNFMEEVIGMEWLVMPLGLVGFGLMMFLLGLDDIMKSRHKSQVEVSKNELETEKQRTERARLELKMAELDSSNKQTM